MSHALRVGPDSGGLKIKNCRQGLLLSLAFSCILGVQAANQLEQGFIHPPDSARPWVYWFWLNGNITSNGITADLEGMKRVGIGGVLIMEVDQGAPVGPVDFMGSQWRSLFKHAASEARRLGLELNMNNDAGWNGSGGPWIKPEQSMQKVVWSETNLLGPQQFEGILTQPEMAAGFYRDIALLAFPTCGTNRIEGILRKAAFEVGVAGESTPKALPPESLIDRGRILDLTGRMDGSGRLNWEVPTGQWTVLRLGHTSTGMSNAPAPLTGCGLECDKLSREGIEANFAGMMAQLAEEAGPNCVKPGASFVATHIDSWENGWQNWTARMPAEFQQRRGYDLLLFLPVMTGRVVESLDVSERFLWDLRRTISELVITNYAGRMRELAHAAGLRFTVEAYGGPCDDLPYAAESDEPMGEFWSSSGAMETCRGMASAGHIYGKPIIGAEAFTASNQEKWRDYPATLKALGDTAFCEGINRFVVHRYALQPWSVERRPGMMMGPWGQHYERTQTWWDQSVGWHTYLARCQYLLRQGLFVADICYLQPERPPYSFEAHPRRGYDYDECTTDVILNRMTVTNGTLLLPDGMTYRVLVLPPTDSMTPQLLRKLKELAQAGATIVGSQPQRSPSLSGFPDCDREVRELAAGIWGAPEGNATTGRHLGASRVFRQQEPEKVLREMGLPPDFASTEPLRYIHRRATGADIYFVANTAHHSVTTPAAFRVSGKIPELWWPESGKVERAAIFQEGGGRTTVALALGPSGSVCVVFRKPSARAITPAALLHDGEPVLSAKLGSPPPVEVERAIYGVLTNANQLRDVRLKVQQKMDAGERSFAVSSLGAGDDPAPDIVKTLVVDYSIHGNHYTVKARDRALVYLTTDTLKLQVEKANYGVPDDPQRTRDVRDKLQGLVDAGESAFPVARMAEGDDPAPGVIKSLEIEYTLDGKHLSLHGSDSEIIELKPPAPEPELLAELRAAGADKLTVQAFKPGRYSLELADGTRRHFTAPKMPPALQVTGPWTVRFNPNWGAPPQATFDTLVSWSCYPDPGVTYYSGTAVYSNVFRLPRGMLNRNRRLYLDMGRVEVMAEVKVNGKPFPLLWKPPFRLDVTGAARSGRNTLEIAVVNLWPNRLIGDEQLPEDSQRNTDGTLKQWPQWLLDGKPSPTGRYTFSMWRQWKKSDPLLPSGLLGPVQVISAQEFRVD
jgi:hypothetical protein